MAADRRNQQASLFQLVQQRRRNFFRRGRNDNPVKGRVFRPSHIAVAHAEMDVPVSQPAQDCRCPLLEVRQYFNGIDFGHNLRQDGRLIAGAGTDLQNTLRPAQFKSLRHKRHNVRL